MRALQASLSDKKRAMTQHEYITSNLGKGFTWSQNQLAWRSNHCLKCCIRGNSAQSALYTT